MVLLDAQIQLQQLSLSFSPTQFLSLSFCALCFLMVCRLLSQGLGTFPISSQLFTFIFQPGCGLTSVFVLSVCFVNFQLEAIPNSDNN